MEPVATKRRPTRPTLARVDDVLAAVSVEALANAKTRMLRRMADRGPLPLRVEIRLDDAQGFVVDGPSRTLEPQGAPVDACFFAKPRDLDRLGAGAIEPRLARGRAEHHRQAPPPADHLLQPLVHARRRELLPRAEAGSGGHLR
jgi:hypothetical protein